MVNRLRLNEKSVREAEPADGRDYQVFDSEVRGFAVCIYRSGNRAFTIDYRHAGRQRRMTIGRWPEWSVTAARERAKELRREIDAGGDPLGQKETGREAPRFRDLIERYTEVHLPHLSALNASDQKSMLAKMVAPDWGNRLLAEITPYDVEKLLNKVAAGRARPSKAKPNNRARKLQGAKPTPVRANRVGEVLRKMFTYAVSWGCRTGPRRADPGLDARRRPAMRADHRQAEPAWNARGRHRRGHRAHPRARRGLARHVENHRHPGLSGHLLAPPAADRGRPARL